VRRRAIDDRHADFVAEFKRRLARLNRLHLAVDAPDRSRRRSMILHAARSDCKLTLMRYVLTPEEVAGGSAVISGCRPA
jgi:hypothetical protein